MLRLLLFSLLFISIQTLLSQTKEDCLACHSDNSLTMEKNGKTISLYVEESTLNKSPHKKFSCVTCHTGFNPEDLPHKEKITPVQCASCHAKDLPKHAFHKTVLASGADQSKLCKECHGTHNVVSPNVAGSKFSKENLVTACGTCHATEKEHFLKSAHGIALAAQNKNAPNCIQCHSVLLPSNGARKDTAAVKLAEEKMCTSCHGDKNLGTGVTTQFIKSYEQSVHAQALRHGNGTAATCIDCHGSHEMSKGSDINSTVNKKNIPNTCAKCHADIAATYKESIHGTSFAKGNMSSPVCTDCHGEHKILAPKDPNSPVSKFHLSNEVCSPCHNSVKLNEKYGLPSGRTKSFMDSYHGLAVKAGSTEAANCASCHGFHDILPSSDPRSPVNKANLAQTCGKCHPGANENFAKGAVHVITTTATDNDIIYFVSNLYIILIVVTIGGMFLHNVIDFWRKANDKLRHRRSGIAHVEVGHALYLRMTLSERLQHGLLALSFITLIVTGFMLRYPDAFWVLSIRSISATIFEIRGILHRVAAVVMILTSIYHIYYIFFTERGKKLVKDLLPKLQDLRDAFGVAKYNLGLSQTKPMLDRFSYIEKAEYWALIWGTIVMSITGFILWFDNTFLGLIGKLWWDVSRTIHFYEAWLAGLAIVVWHFYFIIFNPDVYPMNLAWFKGTISEEEMAHEHPLELERIKEEERKRLEEEQKENNE
ncbi:MAG: cytochrome b/b6 domain-containing protein [Bacteroidetes bacterium]|nr:cytochrome b/b6 domain-containing protein [Bacteroidota bacterium]